MLNTMEPKRKTLECQILSLEDTTGFTVGSPQKDDEKVDKIKKLYTIRGYNIYPIYVNNVVDNNTIEDIKSLDKENVKAYYITKYALKNKHKFDEDEI